MNNDTVPIAFQIIKDNTVSIYEFDEAVAEGLDDFTYHSKHLEEELEQLGIYDMRRIYDMSDDDIIAYVENSPHYLPIAMNRP